MPSARRRSIPEEYAVRTPLRLLTDPRKDHDRPSARAPTARPVDDLVHVVVRGVGAHRRLCLDLH
jgi:hypothetical protein